MKVFVTGYISNIKFYTKLARLDLLNSGAFAVLKSGYEFRLIGPFLSYVKDNLDFV
jgi:hypothetical protein